jgi:hypothetical protein
VLWLPAGTVYGATYAGYKLGGPDPLLGYSPLPTTPQGGVAPITPYANGLNSYLSFVYNTIYDTRLGTTIPAANISRLLSLGAFKYIVDRSDVTYSFLPSQQHELSQQFFSMQSGLRSEDFSSAKLYIINESIPIVSVTSVDSGCIITGGFDSVLLLDKIPDISDKCRFFFFASQLNENQILSVPSKVIVVNDGVYDILYAFIPDQFKIPLENYVPATGWQPLLFYGGLLTSGQALTSNPNYAISSYATSDLVIPVSLQNSSYYVLLKVFNSPSSNAITLRISDYSFRISTRSPVDYWSWKVFGPIDLPKANLPLIISSAGGLTAISSLGIIPSSSYYSAWQSTERFLDKRTVTYIYSPQPQFSKYPLLRVSGETALLLNLSEFFSLASKVGTWKYETGALITGEMGWSSALLNLTNLKTLTNFRLDASFKFDKVGAGQQNYLGFYLSKDHSIFINTYYGNTSSIDIRGSNGVIAAAGIGNKISIGNINNITVTRMNSLVTVMLNGEVVLWANAGNFTLGPIGIQVYGQTSIHSFTLESEPSGLSVATQSIQECCKNATMPINYTVRRLGESDFVISGNGTGSVLIAFLVNYNPNFVIEPSSTGLLGPVPVNGYGMAWLTNVTGNFSYELRFTPTRLFHVGWLIMIIVTATLSLIFVIGSYRLLKLKKRERVQLLANYRDS